MFSKLSKPDGEVSMPGGLSPPFTAETAAQAVRAAEDAWNSLSPELVSNLYALDAVWRSRADFLRGRAAIGRFLTRTWTRELNYRTVSELWAFDVDRIATRYAAEWHDDSGNWYRSFGNAGMRFDAAGLISHYHASINDRPIDELARQLRWDQGRARPVDQVGLSELGF